MITSLRNDKVKYVRALQSRRRTRQRERRFVFEGLRLVEEAVRADVLPDYVFYTQPVETDERGGKLLKALLGVGVLCYAVSEPVLEACADTETPQGILAVLPMPALALPQRPTLTLTLDRVRDPGNLGTILRTALAAGVDQVLLTPGTVDASNPKVVRAAMGAHLHIPVAELEWKAIAEAVRGSEIWLAAADGDAPYTTVNWVGPATLIVGSEAAGAGKQARALARGRVSIPMAPGIESLNVAVATAVLLFEVVRQRRATEEPSNRGQPRFP